MGAKKIQAKDATGNTLYCIIRRDADSFRFNDSDGSFATSPADPYLSLVEDSVIKGLYEVSESRIAWTSGRYLIAVYRQAGGSPAPASDTLIELQDWWVRFDLWVNLNEKGSDALTIQNFLGIK